MNLTTILNQLKVIMEEDEIIDDNDQAIEKGQTEVNEDHTFNIQAKLFFKI